MKKTSILLIFSMLLSACSMTVNEFLGVPPTATIAPTITITNTPADTPTVTVTVPTPTYTLTPTLIGLKTKTPTPNFTPTLNLTPFNFTPMDTTQLSSATPLVLVTKESIPGFVSISTSSEVFYKNKECMPVSVKFTAQVAEPKSVAFVTLFVRFKSKLTGTSSKWTSIPMESSGAPGVFTHDLVPEEMKAVDIFDNAWVQYQLVSTDSNTTQVKTSIFAERLALLQKCVATPTVPAPITPTAAPITPMAASVTPKTASSTPTVPKP